MTAPSGSVPEPAERCTHGLVVLAGGGCVWGWCSCGWLSPTYPARGGGPMPVQLAFGQHLLQAVRADS